MTHPRLDGSTGGLARLVGTTIGRRRRPNPKPDPKDPLAHARPTIEKKGGHAYRRPNPDQLELAASWCEMNEGDPDTEQAPLRVVAQWLRYQAQSEAREYFIREYLRTMPFATIDKATRKWYELTGYTRPPKEERAEGVGSGSAPRRRRDF